MKIFKPVGSAFWMLRNVMEETETLEEKHY